MPALLNLALSLISKKFSQANEEKMTELITPIYLWGTLLCFLIINMGLVIDDVTSEQRKQQVFIMFVLYFYTNAFMSVSYLAHLLIRIISMAVFIVSILAYRRSMGDVTDTGTASILALGILISQELSLYDDHKAKAKLFIEKEVSFNKQEQLANLLNSVPDNVIICTRGTEKLIP